MSKLITFDDFPKDIADALRRAKAWAKIEESTNTLFITSRNKEQPLTNTEKIWISEYIVMRKHWYRKVSFEQYQPPLYAYGGEECN